MLAEKADPSRCEWVLGCDIVKELEIASDLYVMGDVEHIKLFGVPVKVDFKRPDIVELRERKVEPKEPPAEWVHITNYKVMCNKCGFSQTDTRKFNYCPHCGAKMRF